MNDGLASTRWVNPNNRRVAVQALGKGRKVDQARPRLPTIVAEFGRAKGHGPTGAQSWRSLSEVQVGMCDGTGKPS